MIYNITKGNLFDLPKNDYVFAHCIASDLKWGGGIAPILIAKEYNSEKVCRYVEDGGIVNEYLSVGTAFPIFSDNGVFVNLITKEKTWQKPTYLTLKRSLISLRCFMENNKFKKLAMPKIGCGLDRLEWNQVENIIKEVFEDSNIEIEIRYL